MLHGLRDTVRRVVYTHGGVLDSETKKGAFLVTEIGEKKLRNKERETERETGRRRGSGREVWGERESERGRSRSNTLLCLSAPYACILECST